MSTELAIRCGLVWIEVYVCGLTSVFFAWQLWRFFCA
jgi:hypothetical protein